jgi:hypothetical protein
MEQRFTNREITQMIKAINDKLDDHAITHEKILTQVTYTNGKVRTLNMYLIVVGAVLITMILKDPASVYKFLVAIL